MSNNIGTFEPIKDSYGEPMTVTAFVGKDWDRSVQFTIGMEYCALTSNTIEIIIAHTHKLDICINVYYDRIGEGNPMYLTSDFKNREFTFAIRDMKCTVTRREFKRLGALLQKRLDGIKGFRATD